jgi:phage tail sheath protein FI
MAEYLAPAVYVEETSFRSRSIAGAGTSTTAFVGMTARGPVSAGTGGVRPPLLTSMSDFEQYYGSIDNLRIGGAPVPNFLAMGASAFFTNGGGLLYVARVLGAGAVAATTGPSFRTLLADLATLARNTIVTVVAPNLPLTVFTRPTTIQQRAFELADVAL